MKLDEKDKIILQQLRKNARMPMTKIAREAQIPIDVVKYRMKKLEKHRVIQQYIAYVDHEKIGRPLLAYVAITQYNLDLEVEENFRNYLIENPKVTYVAKYSGKWDYCIAICAKDYKELDEVIHDIRTKFSHIIKDYDVMPVIREYKLYQFADLIGM